VRRRLVRKQNQRESALRVDALEGGAEAGDRRVDCAICQSTYPLVVEVAQARGAQIELEKVEGWFA
jgi:hypothetical protein